MWPEILSGIIGFAVGAGGVYYILQNKIAKTSSDLQSKFDLEIQAKQQQLDIINNVNKEQLQANQDRIEQYLKIISEVLEDSANRADITSNDLEQIASKIQILQQMTSEIKRESTLTSETSKDGAIKVNSVLEDLQQLTQSQQDLERIKSQFNEVQEKTYSIRLIAEEAEMLALNAAIEAARAGDAGRGFAVVADSMKSLAKNSQKSTNEILNIIQESEKIINLIVDNFGQRGEILNQSTTELVTSFKEIGLSVETTLNHSQIIESNSIETTALTNTVSENTKTAVETIVKNLSLLVSEITGKRIINLTPLQANQQWTDFDEVIDVRRENEWNDELSHINGVKFCTLQTDFKSHVKTLNRDKKYLFICRSGGRSTKAAQMAIAAGITSVYNLDSGMLEWRKQKF